MTFHDLRGTAVTRLALAGCTEAEIATITGHSLRDVRAILDTHYLAPRSGARRERDPQARKGNKNSQLTAQLVWDVLARKREKRCEINGGRTRARTWDPLIKSRLIIQVISSSIPTKALIEPVLNRKGNLDLSE